LLAVFEGTQEINFTVRDIVRRQRNSASTKLDAADRHQTNVLSRSKVAEHWGNDGYHALH